LPIWRKLASLSQRIIHLLLRKWAPTSFGKRKKRRCLSFDEEGDLVAILRIWHGGGFRLCGRAEFCAFSSWCLRCIILLGRNGPLSIPDFDSCWIVNQIEPRQLTPQKATEEQKDCVGPILTFFAVSHCSTSQSWELRLSRRRSPYRGGGESQSGFDQG
jgi:hypothetical protein